MDNGPMARRNKEIVANASKIVGFIYLGISLYCFYIALGVGFILGDIDTFMEFARLIMNIVLGWICLFLLAIPEFRAAAYQDRLLKWMVSNAKTVNDQESNQFSSLFNKQSH